MCQVPWEAAGVTEHQIGAMLGNSVSVPVIGAAAAEALYAGGLAARRGALGTNPLGCTSAWLRLAASATWAVYFFFVF